MAQQAGQLSPDGKWVWNGAQWVPYAPIPTLAAQVTWAQAFESASFRATFVTIFFLANAAALVMGVILDIVFISSDAALATLSSTEFLPVDLANLIYASVYYGTLIPSVVFFCLWLHRAVRNMPALGAWDARWSPAGAVGRSFIPFLNFAHPMSGTLEAWRASDPTRRWIDVLARKRMGPPALIVMWWMAWIVGGLVSRISFRMAFSKDPGTLTMATWLDLLSSVLLIAAAGLAILVVREVTARQNHKNELIVTGQLA
jgi:hypothetical protein